MSLPLHVLLDGILEGHKGVEIADVVGVSESWVSQVRHGQIIPNDEDLVLLSAKYAPDRLGEFLHAAAFARLRSRKFRNPELKDVAVRSWEAEPFPRPRTSGKRKSLTLQGFPDAFYPLAVVSGDKREDSESRINVADFGVVSASPAEARWIFQLGLNRDVEFYSDKLFVWEDDARLKKRFAERNLLIIGSPGSNHLARRCHLGEPPAGWRRAVPIFRFNMLQERLLDIEKFLPTLRQLAPKELVGIKASSETGGRLKFLLKSLFSGGILDPTYQNLWIRGNDLWGTDFGLISLARNPFANSDEFMCILVAGFHMFGTAHALRMLGEADSQAAPFEKHPLGGVIRVSINAQLPFAERFDKSTAAWDVDSEYTLESVDRGLHDLAKAPVPGVHISAEEIAETIQFVEFLKTVS